MDSRERAILALRHEVPDRIPVDFWASEGFKARLQAEVGLSYDEFVRVHDVDFRYIAGPQYVGPPLDAHGDRQSVSVDVWGVPRKLVTLDVRGHVERYREVIEPPLAGASTVDDVEGYDRWPSPDWFDYADIERQCDRVRDSGRAVVFMGDRLNRIAQLKPAMYIRGVDNIMLDMAVRPELARAVFAKIKAFYTQYLARILEAARGKIDVILTGDDFGAQNGLLVSPAMWNDLLRPGFEEYVALIGAGGAFSMHHTCGSVAELIPDMIECGLDCLQSLQPEAAGMAARDLKRRYGRRLAFHGGVSIQRTLPYGTPEAVRSEVRTLADVMGEGGGYVFCTAHNVQADTPMENALALLSAYREYGRYA